MMGHHDVTLLASLPQKLSEQHAYVDFDHFDCNEVVSVKDRRYCRKQGQSISPLFTEYKHLGWTFLVKEVPDWSELRL